MPSMNDNFTPLPHALIAFKVEICNNHAQVLTVCQAQSLKKMTGFLLIT